MGQKDSFNEPKNLFLLFKRFSNRVSTRHSAKFSPTVAKKQILFKQFFRSGCKTVSKQLLEPFWKPQEMSGNKKALVMLTTSFTCKTNWRKAFKKKWSQLFLGLETQRTKTLTFSAFVNLTNGTKILKLCFSILLQKKDSGVGEKNFLYNSHLLFFEVLKAEMP